MRFGSVNVLIENEGGGGGGAVAKSAQCTASSQEVSGVILALATRSLLVGSVAL